VDNTATSPAIEKITLAIATREMPLRNSRRRERTKLIPKITTNAIAIKLFSFKYHGSRYVKTVD